MRVNGTISFGRLPAKTQFNEDGEPVIVDTDWSKPVECFIQDITEDRRTRTEGGLYTARTFEVFVEKSRWRTIGNGDSEIGELVRLTRRGKELGEFSVSRVKVISLDRIKIFV